MGLGKCGGTSDQECVGVGIALDLLVACPSWAQSPEFHLDGLAQYKPEQVVSGTIRNFGFGLGGVLALWEEGFRNCIPTSVSKIICPRATRRFRLSSPELPISRRTAPKPTLTETLSFFETYGYHPTDITVATGAFDVAGRSNGIVVFVNAHNPITKLTIKQLDGIFGAERTAGMRGFEWTPSDGRGPEQNIRTWGQLGSRVSGRTSQFRPTDTHPRARRGSSNGRF